MYIQKTWITLLVAVALCPMAQKHSCSLAIDNHSTLNLSLESSYLSVDEDAPSVIPLDHAETRSDMATKSQKTTDVKIIEKKKPLRLNDSVKVKNETKFQKLKDPKLDEKMSKMLDVNKTGIDEAPVKGNPGSLLNTPISRAINEADGSEARASNVSALEPTNSLYANHTGDLSDVNMDEEDTSMEGGEYVASHNETQKIIQPMALPTTSMCIDGNTTYALGDTIVRGCDEQCICGENSTINNCKPLCSSPYVIAGRNKQDPFCGEQRVAENHCCAIVYCSENTSGVKADDNTESCTLGNKTVSPGEQIYDGCAKTCICQTNRTLKCQPRCPPNDTNSTANYLDRCVVLTDPRDSCCTITYCDVTLGEHEMKPDDPDDLSVNIVDVKVLNSTAIKLKLSADLHNETIIQVSKNNDDWTQDNPDNGGIISKLEPAHDYFVRVKEGNRTGAALRVIMPAEVVKTNVTEKIMCNHQGKQYKVGEKWYDECIALCICHENGKSECLTLECPTDFGLDVLNPHCLDWETVPTNFVPKAPNCCPEQVRCRNNGSCVYENNVYDNWSEIPSNVTGCEKRCYCEIGKVSCQAACPPVPALPPSTLSCPANQAVLQHLPNDDCCSHWVCNALGNTTSAYVGPLAGNVNSWREIDSENPNKSALSVNKSDATASENTVSNPYAASPMFHYPMDPGYPTLPYNGPFNPDYRPTSASVEKIFQLPDMVKDKSKSKADAKKSTESIKIHHKEIDPPTMYHQQEHREPASPPDKFPLFPNQISGNVNDNPLPNMPFIGPNKPLVFPFTPGNAQGIPAGIDADHFDTNVGPPYRQVRPGVQQMKKKIPDGVKTPDTRKKLGQKTKEILPEDLVHLINLHPALTQLDRPPSPAHPGLDEFHHQITNQREPSGNQIPLGYYNGIGIGVDGSKDSNVHVHNKDEGETIYHIHASEIPSTPQQIEKLLAHISQHDPNLGPFRYPSLSPSMIHHNYPNGRPPPSHVDALNGVPHLNNPFIVQAPNQSDMQEHNFHTGFPMLAGIPGYNSQTVGQTSANEIVIKALDALDDQTVRLIFTVPPVFVGLHGRVELRYTNDKNNMDPSTWKSQLFIPPDDLIATPQLEFELDGLEPATEYKVRVTMNLRDIGNSPSSKIYKVTTLSRQEEQQGVLPPQIPIDAELHVAETNSTWANIVWKKFTEYEMQFIDGVQLRYKEHDGKVYSTTPLIHRAVTNYVIENLKPMCTYEVGISIIPFPGQTTELISEKKAQLVTAMESDPYAFDVKVDIKMVKSQDVEITWTGVPYPEDKYVNIYRAIYQSDSGKGDTSTFKIAKRDSPAKTLISGLKPGTRYRLWLEMYLTNGKIKKSNVQDFITKPGVVLTSVGITQQSKLASLSLHEDDYYGPLVIVAIVASLAILSTLILLMMLMKRRSSSKADISPRKTTSAYDNPSYKTCEDLVTITNGGNKVTQDHELLDVNPCEQKEPA